MKNNASTLRLALRFVLASVLLASLTPLAHAQWSWKDKEGRRIFSDQPPPTNVPDKDILKRPVGSRVPAPAIDTAASAPSSGTATTATTPTLKISGKDAELEKKKKETEAQEAAKKKAEAEKVAASRKENCDRAKNAKANFDSGQRIATTNAKGEREIMSDSTRATETKRLQDIIGSNCS